MPKSNLRLITACVCTAILLAGLWPFSFHPQNQVKWIGKGNGLRFSGRGIVTGGDDGLFTGGPISIEIWLRPDSVSGRDIMRAVSFSDGEDDELVAGQWKSGLVLMGRAADPDGHAMPAQAELDGVFSKGVKRFVTITSGADGTVIYLEGAPAKSFSRFVPYPGGSAGSVRPILGNSPDGGRYWTGDILGFSVYNRALTPGEVSRSYRAWREKGMPDFPAGEGPIALYLFDEHAGTVVHNHQGLLHPLTIPSEFRPLARTVLVPPWRDFSMRWSYFQDIAVNIAGFIPFGFFVSALLLGAKPLAGRKAILVVILLGFGLSLFIELVQVYLPTRDSQLSDVICNTLGTAAGAMLFARVSRTAPY